MSELSWCGGFFDGEGSFSFSSKHPIVMLVNTNPLAVTSFFEIMKRNDIDFKISERSKPSKSSKKKRWDLYICNRETLKKFLNLMSNFILGKNKQLELIKKYYNDNNSNLIEYHKNMQYLNQTSNVLIKDENVLLNKLKIFPEIKTHIMISNENSRINYESFNDIDYFCGVLDAEGTVSMNKRQNKNRNTDRFTPVISFVNTNKVIVEKCCSVLKNNNIGHHIQFRIPTERNRGRWDVSVAGIKRIKLLTDLLKNKLVIKNRQVDLLNKYCSLRINDLMSDNQFGASFKESIEALNKEN